MNVKIKIIATILNFKTLPTTITQLCDLTRKDTSNAKDYERVIKKDPAMTANLLRLANSSYFGCQRHVGDVRQAITLLGSQRVFELALSLSFSKAIPSHLAGYGLSSLSFWHHCSSTAVIAEYLIKVLKMPPVEMLFTAGLLHDMGKLAISQYFEDNPTEEDILVFDGENDILEIEDRVLGTNHSGIGSLVASHWNLPDSIAHAARWHHLTHWTPESCDAHRIDLVHVADRLSHALERGDDGEMVMRSIAPASVERLGLTPELLDEVAENVSGSIESLQHLIA